ncbi:hypothetical protein M404DRAFT_852145 [Pisolithus tinctorius Marx 270]|uniref:Uncharacterized protein n=1 Tax=Pisolithus tinctorius Marx 270 TaxID=870435 RepID=A0A0C3NTB9_PISTI|nr:hypothetical protein M404DRAFT_852145 [Pisolithus tinctorius Marx 270]
MSVRSPRHCEVSLNLTSFGSRLTERRTIHYCTKVGVNTALAIRGMPESASELVVQCYYAQTTSSRFSYFPTSFFSDFDGSRAQVGGIRDYTRYFACSSCSWACSPDLRSRLCLMRGEAMRNYVPSGFIDAHLPAEDRPDPLHI